MTLKLQSHYHLRFLSLKGGCTGSSESTHVKMPHCWKSHVTAHICLYLQKCQLLSWKVMTAEWRVCYIRLMRVPGMSPNTWSLVVLTSQSHCGISMMGASYTHSLFMEVKWVSYWYHQTTVMWVFIPILIKWYFEVKEDFYELYDIW